MPMTRAKLAGNVWTGLGQLVTPGPTGPRGPQGPMGTSAFPLVGRFPVSLASWTWLNQGTATVEERGGAARFTFPNAATENLRALVTPVAAGTPTYTAALMGWVTGGNYQLLGITFHETVSGKFASLMVLNAAKMEWRKNTSATVWSTSGAPIPYQRFLNRPGPYYVQAALTATQYILRWSVDGVNFIETLAENLTPWFTARPDRVGIVGLVLDPAPTAQVTLVSWSET